MVSPSVGGAFGWPGVAARLRERPLRSVEAAYWVAAARTRVAMFEPDEVVAHWAVPCAFPIGFAAKAPMRVVSHGGDVRLLSRLPSVVRSAIVSLIVARARSWNFASRRLLIDLLRLLGRKTRTRLEAVATVSAPPIEMPDVRAGVASRRSEFGGAPFAVCVGRIVASKRVDLVIEYAARSDWPLVVVGDGPERRRLERLARSLGARARFVGAVPRPEALAWIGAAKVLIHASEAEGLSTVIREAEALGTRVLTLRAGNEPQMHANGTERG